MFCAITKSGVEVAIQKLTEDLDDVTIEVIDNNGNKVAVKPLNLVINEEEAEFKFVNELSADPVGVWKVAGIVYDCDVAALLKDINDAADELALWNALKAADIKNLKVENSKEYYDADKPDDGFETLAEVQEFVNEVNADLLSNEEYVELIEALADALNGPSDVVILDALSPWVRVNEDWLGVYKTDLGKMNTSNGPDKDADPISDEFEAVQEVIDNANIEAMTNGSDTGLVDKAEASAVRADYNDAVAAMKYVRADDPEKDSDTTKADLQARLDTLNLVINVKEASTAARFANAYDALVAHVDDETVIGDEEFYTDLRKDYMKATNVDVDDVVNAAGIEAAIAKVNNTKRKELVEAVSKYDASTNKNGINADTPLNTVLKKLQDLAAYTVEDNFDIETVEATESRLTAYRTKLAVLVVNTSMDVTDGTTLDTAIKAVQAQITAANNEAVTEPLGKIADDGTSGGSAVADADELLDLLENKELGLKNVVKANKDAYFAELDTASYGFQAAAAKTPVEDAIKAVQTLVNDINLLVDINEATKAQEVHDALMAISGNDDYINIPSADRLWVAAKVLEARNEEAGKVFATLDDLMGGSKALKTATTAHGTALSGVNALTITDTTTTVVSKLAAIDADYAKLSAGAKADIAEPFFLSLEFDDTSGKVSPPFRTLAAIIEAAGL